MTGKQVTADATIRREVEAAGGWLPFDRFLQHALHDPVFGYYGSGRVDFGSGGDFHTAPTISPLFGEVLACQFAPLLAVTGGGILELGGGDGDLAEHLLRKWARLPGAPPLRYLILETSAALRRRQQQKLAAFAEQVEWLDTLPERHGGIILANEVLDCVPFRLFVKSGGDWLERGVVAENGAFAFADRPPSDTAHHRLQALALPDGYQTELSPQAEALATTLARVLTRGYMLFADYGFGRQEFYHPQRSGGTMMCHRRQQADDSPLTDIGDKDITAHIDFTAIADAGVAGGGELCGYTTQAHFLINAGITERLAAYQEDAVIYARQAAGAHKLLAPHEMGELFKWMAFSKGDIPPLPAFSGGDKRHLL